MSILTEIKSYKIKEVAQASRLVPLAALKRITTYSRQPLSISNAVINGSGIIAEFKRASPSKGYINKDADVQSVTVSYEDAGVSAISVLTDHEFFKAKKEDLVNARAAVNIPILRKDFVVDDYQIYEAKSIGADAILLIAAILTSHQVKHFTDLAHDLGLEVLVEVHNEQELNQLCGDEDMVGVNNRNLNDFSIDLNTSIELIKLLGGYPAKISESGISSIENIKELKSAGYNGFLIGEHFMRSGQIDSALSDFVKTSIHNG